MSDVFSLLTRAWIPVRRERGQCSLITPSGITSDPENPIIDFAWPRPDFVLASYELLIGLLAASCPPKDDGRDWLRRFNIAPTEGDLAEAFAPFARAFELDGDGPRFLQDFSSLKGEAASPESLFIEAPGANTVKENKDLLVKRGRMTILSRATAAMALYTLQQFAPSGGAGHRTSLRGGGPLVTLALPGRNSGEPPLTLWQKLWLNVPPGLPADKKDFDRIFPWLAPTKTSEKKQVINQSDAHDLQAFFGMPRRTRLVFEANPDRHPCDVTGAIDTTIITGFVSEPWGVNYGAWRHPLTPYKVKPNTAESLPVHAPKGRLGFRQWLGLVYVSTDGDRTLLPADIIAATWDRLSCLEDEPHRLIHASLIAGGYAMDKAKALAFAETEMPMHLGKHREEIRELSEQLIKATMIVASWLGIAIKQALFEPEAKIALDATLIEAPRERLWEVSEAPFHDSLDRFIETSDAEALDEAKDRTRQSWRRHLRGSALTIFDDAAPLDATGSLDPQRIVEARKMLFLNLEGYTKTGKDLFKVLALEPPPESKSKKSRGNPSKED
jgi:CRISPR system Cascade subunit CasA